jgi:TetR/AcrR family transcriptional repressor of mexJK operon
MIAAKTVFYDDGYQLASMEKIAQACGASKRTLYDHFGSKETLFTDAIRYSCEQFLQGLPDPDLLPLSPATGLVIFLERVVDLLVDPDGIRMQRTIIAEGERWPVVARMMAEAEHEAEVQLVAYMKGCVTSGLLAEHDAVLTARTLLDVATSWARIALWLGSPPADVRARSSQLIRVQVDLVMTKYGSQAQP